MTEPMTPKRLAEIRELFRGAMDGLTVHELCDEVERLREVEAVVEPSVEDITPDIAAMWLWRLGEKGGLEPIYYIAQLMVTIALARDMHRARLGQVYPGYVAASDLARRPGGVEQLRVIAAKARP